MDFEKTTMRRNFTDVMLFVCFLVFNSYLAVVSRVQPREGNSAYLNSPLIEFILTMFLTVQLVAMVGIPVVNYLNTPRYDQFIRHIVEVDKALDQLGHRHDYSAELFYCALYTVGSLTLQFGCLSGMILTNPFHLDFQTGQDIIGLISFLMCNMVYITSTCYCCASLWMVVYRYLKLNNTFSFYFHTELQSTKTLLPISESLTIKTIAVLYSKLGTAVQLYNRCFFIHIFYVLGSAFGLNLVSLFTIVHVILTHVDDYHLIDPIIVTQVFLSLFYLLVILQIMFAGNLLHKKAKQTAALLHKAVVYNDCDSTVLEQLRSFSIQLSHQIPKATCYFYDIDWKFLLRMISSFATYLNILVQFDIMQLTLRPMVASLTNIFSDSYFPFNATGRVDRTQILRLILRKLTSDNQLTYTRRIISPSSDFPFRVNHHGE